MCGTSYVYACRERASLINRYGYLSVRGQFAIGRISAVTTLMHGECSKYIKFTAWL